MLDRKDGILGKITLECQNCKRSSRRCSVITPRYSANILTAMSGTVTDHEDDHGNYKSNEESTYIR